MKIRGKIVNLDLDYISHKPKLTLQLESMDLIISGEYDNLKDIDALDIEIEKHREKRSKTQNAYAWELITQLGNKLLKSKEEIYYQMLKDYGQSELISALSTIDLHGYYKYFEKVGSGEVNGKEFTHYKIFKGSSEFNTLEMKIFIDGIIQECESVGIPTLTENEISKMKLN